MNERPLLVSGTDIPAPKIWLRLAGLGPALYGCTVGALWLHSSLRYVPGLFWGLVITAGMLIAFAIQYVAAVMRLTGSSKGAWSLPDVATAEVALDPERALRRVEQLAENAYPWVLSTIRERDGERELWLARRSRVWGHASVTVSVEPKGKGALFHLRAGSKNFVNNGIERGMIARLTADLSKESVVQR